MANVARAEVVGPQQAWDQQGLGLAQGRHAQPGLRQKVREVTCDDLAPITIPTRLLGV